MDLQNYTHDAIELLKQLIATPSVSRDEHRAATLLAQHIERYGFNYRRKGNNLLVTDPHYSPDRPTILLNAHIDTVKPVDSWTRDPYTPTIENNDKLYGLGSNDCGGGLVSLLQVFRLLTAQPQKYNLLYLASAEEEVSGGGGIKSILPSLPPVDVAIVGEPTSLQPAIAEKGLMVLDITTRGKSGHAARGEGINAIYQAIDDLNWLHSYRFDKVSDLLGPTLMNVTMIQAGTQHNVVPDRCDIVVDIRTNEHYTNREVYDLVCSHVKGEVRARSFHLQSSHIDKNHILIRRCREMKLTPFGSPTLSDQALMPFPSFKLGPGDSARSHSADEFMRIGEIEKAIRTYLTLLDGIEITVVR